MERREEPRERFKWLNMLCSMVYAYLCATSVHAVCAYVSSAMKASVNTSFAANGTPEELIAEYTLPLDGRSLLPSTFVDRRILPT